jgi:beta-glucosidase
MKREMRNMATKQELAESHSDVRLLTVNRGSAKVLAQHIISPLEGLKAQGVNCRHAPGVPVFGALPHAEPETISPVQLRWFNSLVVGENLAHEQTITLPEYMIKEAWPTYLEKEYCINMSFTLRPTTSGSHVFSVITTGKADVLVKITFSIVHRSQSFFQSPSTFTKPRLSDASLLI